MTPKILFLADINSPHTRKWITGLASDNFVVGIFSLNQSKEEWWSGNSNILCLGQNKMTKTGHVLNKLNYLFFLPRLLFIILKFKPNVIHAHYASSYGLLGALSLFKPLFVSAWGSDVMEFPKKNFLCGWVIRFVAFRARKIFVTSQTLKKEIGRYTDKHVTVIPFGVNLNEFYRIKNENETREVFTFGCLKYFEKIYNIDKVISAFHLLVKKYPSVPMKLLLVGSGSQEEQLRNLIHFYGLQNKTELTGAIPHSMVPVYLNKMDVLVNVSENESFGVSVAEALACHVPVIVSNIEGFKDLIPDKSYGLITETTETNDILLCMENYLLDNELRTSVASKGYQFIQEKFNWSENLQLMEKMYFEFV